MYRTPLRVLVVGSDEAVAAPLRILDELHTLLTTRAATYEEGVRAAVECAHDALLAPFHLDGHSGAALVRGAVDAGCRSAVILVADGEDPRAALDAVRAGAVDVLPGSDLSPALLERTIRHGVERKRTEEALRESRRELSTLLVNLPGMAYRCHNDPRWTMEFVSDGCRELTGWEPSDLERNASVAWGDLVIPEDRARVWREIQAAIQAGRPFRVEYHIRTRTGAERRVSEHGVAVRARGKPLLLEGFVSDVTERWLAETALRRSEEYFRALIETAEEVFVVGNADGTVRYASPAIAALTGRGAEEWNGRAFFDAVHPGDQEAARTLFERLLRDPGVAVTVDLRVLRADGAARLVEVSARNLLGAPAVGGLVYNLRDVTVRHEADEALRRRERHFRSLIEMGQDLITVLEGDGDLRFTSPAVERVLGFGRDALTGSYLPELAHPDDVPVVLDLFDRAMRSPGQPQWGEFRMRRQDGAWRRLEHIVTSLLHDSAVAGIVMNSRDVTDRREAEEALRLSQQQFLQAQKMDAVGRLAGGVAHDFNNLLTAIRGNAELLLFDLPPGAAGREEVEEIRRASDRAAALTRQLLAFSRRQVLQPRVLALNTVVQDMEKMLRRLIGEDVELVTRLGAGPASVRADPGQLEQVLMNLAVNARDAMPSGGRLVVETSPARLDEGLRRVFPYVVPGEYVLLSVSDSGQGMDPETRERAFEPFFTTKPAGRGTGLGLSTVYGIVKQSGGFIWIDSELGQGTNVRIYLPPAEAAEAGEGAGAARPAAARGAETVLLAEDEETVRRLASRVLRRSGYTVLEAGDGEEALRVAAEHPGRIHLLITDVVMPRMGGRDLAAKLTVERAGLRVLYVSGYNEEAVARHGVLDPGTSFIEKPFTAESLTEKVRHVLDEALSSAS